MFRPLALFIGLRYTRAKRRNHFLSFISIVSMIGIALGVAVLITVLSVMNGFDAEIKERVFSMVPPITITSPAGSIADWQPLQQVMQSTKLAKASAPFISAEVLLSHGGIVQPALLNGILPAQEKNISKIATKMIEGKLDDLKPGRFGVILGENLMQTLGATIGSKITVVTPQVSLSPAGVTPRFKRFTVIGVFRAGNGFGFDRAFGFVQLNDAQKLMGYGENVTGLHVSIDNVYAAQSVATRLSNEFLQGALVTTWTDTFGDIFHAVKLEKTMMFFILLLLIGIAAFNLVSSLVMVVSEKESDIAILRTFGATPNMVMQIFIIQGGLIGIIGTALGVLLGLLLALNATEIVHFIESTFHLQLLTSSVYFVNYLPSKVEVSDIIRICIASLSLSFLATIYPARRAAKMDPVESLRYE